MDEDVLGFLDGPAEPQKPDAAQETAPAKDGQQPAATVEAGAEGEKPAAGATPVAPAAAVPTVGEEIGEEKGTKAVPLATFLDMRDRAIAAEKKAKEFEAPEGFTPPDPKTNPGEYLQFRENMVHLNILNERMNFSEKFAVKEHGKELVDKARDWAAERFKTDTTYEDRVMNEVDPYEVVIADYQRHLVAEEFKDQSAVDEFRAWKAAKANGGKPLEQPKPASGAATLTTKPAAQAAGGKTPVQPQRAASTQEEALPTTIGDLPSQGGQATIPVGSGQAFDSLFQGR